MKDAATIQDGRRRGAADADKRNLATAMPPLIGFIAAEVVIGMLAKSLALISGAAHWLGDVGSIGLALVVLRC